MRRKMIAGLLVLLPVAGLGQTVIATIPVGVSPRDVAVNPVTNRVYVSNWGPPGTVSVINGASNTVVATIPVGPAARGIGVNSATNQVYVAVCCPGQLVVIDGSTNTIAGTFANPGAPIFAQDVDVNPATNLVYVTGSGTHVFDPTSNTFVAFIPASSVGIAVDDIANRLYVGYDPISVIDGTTNAVVQTIPNFTGAHGLDVNPYTNRLFVCEGDAAVCCVFDTLTGERLTIFYFGGGPRAVAVNRTLNRIYVGDYGYLIAFDGLTLAATYIPYPAYLGWIDLGVNENTGRIYASIFFNNSLVVFEETPELNPAALSSTSTLAPGCAGPGSNPNCPNYNVDLLATVANTGAVPTGAVMVGFAYSTNGGATFTNIGGPVRVSGIGAGGTAVATKTWMQVQPGTYLTRVTVDPDNLIAETSESNNESVFSVSVP